MRAWPGSVYGLHMRGETARLYREMYEEGYDPTRGLGVVYGLMIATSLFAIIVFFLAVVALYTGLAELGNPITNALGAFGEAFARAVSSAP